MLPTGRFFAILSTNARALVIAIDILSNVFESHSLRTTNGRNNLTPIKALVGEIMLLNQHVRQSFYHPRPMWILTSQSSGETINIYDASHHFVANRRTDLHASSAFLEPFSAILCFINRAR